MVDTYIVLGQQAWAELKIIVQIKGPSSLESSTKGRHRCTLRQLLHTFHAPELAVRVLRC